MSRVRHAPDKMTRRANHAAAFAAVALGRLDKIDAGLIARCTGTPLAEVEGMIAARHAREGRP